MYTAGALYYGVPAVLSCQTCGAEIYRKLHNGRANGPPPRFCAPCYDAYMAAWHAKWHSVNRVAKRPPRLCIDCNAPTNRGGCSKRCLPCADLAVKAREKARVRDPAKTRVYCRDYYRRDPVRSAILSANKTHRRRSRLKAAKIIDPVTRENWAERVALFGGFCAYCDQPATDRDHVMPIDSGGADDIFNVVPACQSCNTSKGAKNPLEWAGVTVCQEQ